MTPVSVKFANDCIAQYNTTMKDLGITTAAEGLTNSVGFPGKDLIKWLQSVAPYMAELRVVFGVYPQPVSSSSVKSGSEPEPGRLTVFLWPYDAEGNPATDGGGTEINPVNVGDLIP